MSSSTARSDARARRLLPAWRAAFLLTSVVRQPLVSVVMATYNRGALLAERTLPPILRQTYRNLEVVIAGDGCTDDTGERLQRIGDPRIRWENLPQRGVYPENPFDRWLVAGTPAANRAMERARGRWIAWCDDDDVWTEDHLQVLLDHARATRAEFVYGALSFQRSPDEWLRIGALPPQPGHIPHSAVLYRRYLRAFRYDLEAWKERMPGDGHRWTRLTAAGVRFSFLDRVVGSSPLRPGDDLRGQRAAEEARAAWLNSRTDRD
jgi:glycosyltransferase involved in cell wall biosynthesis